MPDIASVATSSSSPGELAEPATPTPLRGSEATAPHHGLARPAVWFAAMSGIAATRPERAGGTRNPNPPEGQLRPLPLTHGLARPAVWFAAMSGIVAEPIKSKALNRDEGPGEPGPSSRFSFIHLPSPLSLPVMAAQHCPPT